MYPSYLLPPSPINPVEPVPVQWPNGTVINWVGEYQPKEYKSIYANRNTLFKGHKRERDLPARRKEIADRVESMDKRIAQWKAVSVQLLSVDGRGVPRLFRLLPAEQRPWKRVTWRRERAVAGQPRSVVTRTPRWQNVLGRVSSILAATRHCSSRR